MKRWKFEFGVLRNVIREGDIYKNSSNKMNDNDIQ